jgi:ribosomal protein L40E
VAADTVICRRCGVANASGDQFCGSCGAFLEWESDEAPPPAEAEALVEEPTAPPPAAEPPPPPPPVVVPTAVSAAAAPPPELQPQPGFTVCPHCGSGNPPGRTFCHKCGKLLARAEPGPGAAAGGAGGAATKPRSRGLPGWLPIVIGAGLIVGIVVVLVTVVFKPAPPPSIAAPSATLTPTLAVPPSVSLQPASVPASGGVAVPSAGAGESVQLTFTGATGSSVAADTPDVAAGNVIDGRLDTRWEEAVGSQPGEWVEVTFASSRLDYLVVYNGFQLSHDSFLATKRPQNIIVTVNGVAPAGFVLADSETPQRIDVADTPGATVVRIQIVSTYPASASAYPGSPIEAAAISEIRALGAAGG